MRKKILITGGSGLLALNWAVQCRDDYEVVLCLHERQVFLSGVTNIFCDLSSVYEVKSVIQEIRPHCVIHAAGLTNVDVCEEDADLSDHVNVTLASNVAKACLEQETSLVHISTDHLFSGEHQSLSESSIVSPVNAYGRSKALAEEVVLSVNDKALVVRTNFYGWGTSYRHSFSDFIIQNLRNGKIVKLFDDVFYSPIVIERLVTICHELIEINASGIVHVVGDERLSKYCFGEKLASVFDLDVSLIQRTKFRVEEGFVKRPLDMSLSNCKVSKMLNKEIGNVDMHLNCLLRQEKAGVAAELNCL
jgi:dTDP-4-dehydrorhamnose reductase